MPSGFLPYGTQDGGLKKRSSTAHKVAHHSASPNTLHCRDCATGFGLASDPVVSLSDQYYISVTNGDVNTVISASGLDTDLLIPQATDGTAHCPLDRYVFQAELVYLPASAQFDTATKTYTGFDLKDGLWPQPRLTRPPHVVALPLPARARDDSCHLQPDW